MLFRPLFGATSSSPDETLLEDTLTVTGFQVLLGSLTATAPRIPRSRLGDPLRHDLGSARGLPGRRRSYDPAGSSPGFFITALFAPLWRATAPVYWVLVSHSYGTCAFQSFARVVTCPAAVHLWTWASPGLARHAVLGCLLRRRLRKSLLCVLTGVVQTTELHVATSAGGRSLPPTVLARAQPDSDQT